MLLPLGIAHWIYFLILQKVVRKLLEVLEVQQQQLSVLQSHLHGESFDQRVVGEQMKQLLGLYPQVEHTQRKERNMHLMLEREI